MIIILVLRTLVWNSGNEAAYGGKGHNTEDFV